MHLFISTNKQILDTVNVGALLSAYVCEQDSLPFLSAYG